MGDWFEELTGFKETNYLETQSRFRVEGDRLYCLENQRSFGIGTLELLSLGELRQRGACLLESLRGPLRLRNVRGDVFALHCDKASAGALFQVASQFNLLEMVAPTVSPEAGVTRYQSDRTQGPACAMAAGAATIYRNYFVPVFGQVGQTRERQLDGLADMGRALGNHEGRLWSMQNGYALPTSEGLAEVDAHLAQANEERHDELRSLLRVGFHQGVEVTASVAEPMSEAMAETEAASEPHCLSQLFCSALPVAYSPIPSKLWSRFARLVLEAAYEATFWAAAIQASKSGNNALYLTSLGGGAFGNETVWILSAIERAVRLFRNVRLEVHILSYGQISPELRAFRQELELILGPGPSGQDSAS